MPQKAHSLASDESELEQMYKTYQDLLQQSVTALSMLTKTDSLDTDAGAELDAVHPELKAARHDMRGLHKLEKTLKNDSKSASIHTFHGCALVASRGTHAHAKQGRGRVCLLPLTMYHVRFFLIELCFLHVCRGGDATGRSPAR